MRKTKIICTLGPSTDKDGVLRELIANGMNVARFNFSHGSHEEHKGRLDLLKSLREELGKPVAALLDTKGPEIRLKDFKNGTEMLEAGQTFTLTTRDVEGTKEICSITYKDLPQDVAPGGTIMLDDGLIKLQIQTVNDTDIVCTVLNSGKIKNKKGVNVPGVHLSMPYMSQRDKDDIIFGIEQGFDFIAASFVRTAQDVYEIRNLLNEYDSNIRIIAKIENREGVNNIDSILSAADAVMVARGDLGVEVPFEELPEIQKNIIKTCISRGKRVVTETDTQASGTSCSRRATSVPLPAPDGPEITNRLPCRMQRLAQTLQQSGLLALAQTAQAAALGDLQFLHDLLGFGLAVARHGLDKRGNLHAADHGIVLHLENLRQGELAALQLVTNLGALDASRLRLFQSRLTLFRAELRNSHRVISFCSKTIP